MTSEKSEKPGDAPRRPDSDASSGVVNHGMTVEDLKAEILADVAASDTDTPYDRKAFFFCESGKGGDMWICERLVWDGLTVCARQVESY